jgi:hypothetical protein
MMMLPGTGGDHFAFIYASAYDRLQDAVLLGQQGQQQGVVE